MFRWFHRKKTRDHEIDEELNYHLDLLAQERTEAGDCPTQAKFVARKRLGNKTQVAEELRQTWRWMWMDSLRQDLRYGFRALRKSPGFTAIAVVTLGLGIGANTAIFSVIEAVLLRPLPYHDPSRLVLLTDPEDPDEGGILYRDFEFWKSESRSFAGMAVYYRDSRWSTVTLTGNSEPQTIQGAFVSANFFSVMGVSPILGRPFTTEEELRRERIVLLSHGLWTSSFGSSPDVVGQALQIDGISYQIVGVMATGFQFPAADSAFWAPITTNRYWGDPALQINNPNHDRAFYARWQAVGRLKPGVTQRSAQAEMDTIGRRLERASPSPQRASGIAVIPLHVNVRGNTKLALAVLFAAVCLVLLIACTNVANLVLARGAARQREISLRTALGAGRARILRQLFTESLILAILAACFGVALAPAAIRVLIALAPPGLPRLQEAHVDAEVLAFTFAIAALSAILFGLIPAWKSSRSAPIEPLKSGTRSASGSTHLHRVRSLLAVTEFALAVILLAGAGLLLRSFLIVKAIDPGFRPEHVLTMHITLPASSPVGRGYLLDEMTLARVRSIPGVQAVGAIAGLFSSRNINDFGLRAIEGRPSEASSRWTPLAWTTIRGSYFQAMGTQLLSGRFFSDSDSAHSPLVVIVNETVARRYWPGQNAVGKRFKGFDKRGNSDDWLTVIGVVQDTRRNGLDRTAAGQIYEWYRQSDESTPDLVVRASGDPAALAGTLRKTIRTLDRTAILSSVSTVEQQLAEQLSPRRFETWLLSLFSLVALALASLGIYGVIHYGVTQRTNEIGIRMALGAMPSDIQHLVIREGLFLGTIGLGFGLAGALGLTRFLSSLLYGVKSSDLLTFSCVSVLLLSMAVLASSIPARRAARLDPVSALRQE